MAEKEPMQVQQPATDPQTQATEPQDETEAIMGMLERLQVKTPKDLEGMATASKSAGQLANMVGQLRQEIAQRDEAHRQMLEQLQAAQRQQAQDPYAAYDQPASGNIDIAKVLEGVVERVYVKKRGEEMQNMAQTRAAFVAQMREVQGDPHYEVLKDSFEAVCQDPEIQFALQTGQTDLARVFQQHKTNWAFGMLEKVGTALKKATGKGAKATGVSPPHLETGSGPSGYVQPGQAPDKRQQIAQVREKNRGNDADIDDMLNILLPPDDPLLRRG